MVDAVFTFISCGEHDNLTWTGILGTYIGHIAGSVVRTIMTTETKADHVWLAYAGGIFGYLLDTPYYVGVSEFLTQIT